MLKFELSEQMVMVIGQLLDQAPHKIARPIIDELQRQIDEQKSKVNSKVRDIETDVHIGQ